MKFYQTRWLGMFGLTLGVLAAMPAWACTDAAGTTLITGTPGLGLVLTTDVDKPSAKPGDILSYALVFCNAGDAPISDLEIDSATPASTDFVAASCGALPPDMTCIVSAEPAIGGSGGIAWTLSGALAPSVSGIVNFKVSVR